MNNRILLLSLVLLAASLADCRSAGNDVTDQAPPAGFSPLFDGKSLVGWWGASGEDAQAALALAPDDLNRHQSASQDSTRHHWSVQQGELVGDGQGLPLATKKMYRDFELLADYRTMPGADSEMDLKGCPEGLSGDPASNTAPARWNHLRVVECGARSWVWLNGKSTVVDAARVQGLNPNLPVPPAGWIQLQTRGGETRWRNLFIRELPGDEANQILRGIDPEGFKTVFNGTNLDGWAGPLDCCSVRDATIVWQLKKGGTIYTRQEFTNFIVRLEFKLPPGGNNGLAIRYPGSGDTAYVGMCECQVLDDHYEEATGEKIDPRQAHGSAYGMVAAARGYQRPIGDWNYEEVTVVGPTMKVELNGSVILNCDLSRVTTFMGNHPHPGKDRSSGHFGLAGHNDPVAFRNLAIESLN